MNPTADNLPSLDDLRQMSEREFDYAYDRIQAAADAGDPSARFLIRRVDGVIREKGVFE